MGLRIAPPPQLGDRHLADRRHRRGRAAGDGGEHRAADDVGVDQSARQACQPWAEAPEHVLAQARVGEELVGVEARDALAQLAAQLLGARRDLLFQHAVEVALLFDQAEIGADLVDQLVVIDGLRQVVHRAHCVAFLLEFLALEGGREKDNRDVAGLAPYLEHRRGLETVQVRHLLPCGVLPLGDGKA